jgi:CRP-like cAMP-binding protein
MASRGLEALAQVPLFSHLSRRELRKVLGVAEEYGYDADRVIAREGDAGEAFFVILEGEARVVRRGKVVAKLLPGDFFGEISLLDGGPRTATVAAATPLRCLVLLGTDFRRLLLDDGRLGAKVLQETARRLRQIDRPLRG